jgi:modulator of FtsH protease
MNHAHPRPPSRQYPDNFLHNAPSHGQLHSDRGQTGLAQYLCAAGHDPAVQRRGGRDHSRRCNLPAPGLVLTLVGYFGLLFAVFKLQNSAWALPAVFALTGFMGYTLGPLLSHSLALPGGAQTVTLALASTGATFLALSSYVLLTRRDFSFMGGFLFVGMVIALIAGIAAMLLQMPALGLAVSAMVALLSAGLILFETSRIVNGGETNYVMATVSLYVSVFNLFTSLLSLFGLGGSND